MSESEQTGVIDVWTLFQVELGEPLTSHSNGGKSLGSDVRASPALECL